MQFPYQTIKAYITLAKKSLKIFPYNGSSSA